MNPPMTDATTIETPPGAELMLVRLDNLPEKQAAKVREAVRWAYVCRDVLRMYEDLKPELGWKRAYERVAERLPVSERQARRIVNGG